MIWLDDEAILDRLEVSITTLKEEPWVSLIDISCSLQYEVVMSLPFPVDQKKKVVDYG